jgi:ABC-type branched-subunit amino acid transport system substrate-binding protein
MPLAEENEMPIIAITSGTTFLDDKGGEYIWRVTPSDSLLGRPQPLYAIEQGWDKMAVAHLDNKGSQSFARSVASFHESQGGEVVKEVALPPAASSYRSEISSLVDADPDVIHVTASENGFPLFLTNYREQGIDIPLMGGNEVTQDTIIEQVGADAIEGVYGIANVPGENYNAFVENYEGEYDESPGIFAPEAYDAMNLLGLAWERAGAVGPQELIDNIRPVATPDGTQVIDYPSGKEELDADSEVDYEGAATPCNFDEDGDVYGSMAVMQATDGEWVETKVYDSSDLRTDN